MSTETLLVTPPTVITRRIAVLATVLVLTSLVAIPGSLFYPEPATGDVYTLGDLRPIREFWWAWNTILSINGVLNIPALALAGVLLVPRRGGQWALAGAVMMWLGTALYAVGISGMATAFYVATDPVLDDAVSTALLAGLNSDPQTYAARDRRQRPGCLGDDDAGGRSTARPDRSPVGSLDVAGHLALLRRAHQCRRDRTRGRGPDHLGRAGDRLVPRALPLMAMTVFAALLQAPAGRRSPQSRRSGAASRGAERCVVQRQIC